MPDYRSEARRAAARHGLDPHTFERQIGAESGFNPHAGSSAGAIGIAQFMPGTAAGLGVNPRNPVEALNGAAKLMASYVKKYGSYRNALVAYNAGPGAVGGKLPGETVAYIAKILGPHGGQTSLAPRRGHLGPAGGGSRTITTTTPGSTDWQAALRAALLTGQKNPLLGAAYRVSTGAYNTAPTTSSRTVAAAHGPGPSAPLGRGSVKVAAGANRAGVGLSPELLGFARSVSAVFGSTFTLTTGSNHHRLTTTGNVSDHWDGHGGDFAASGAKLTRMGQAALIAAGMNPKKAKRIKGGAITLTKNGKRIQIIFNSNIGGNHYDHLHLGVR